MISVASSFPEITITIKISNIQDYHHQLHSDDDDGNDGDNMVTMMVTMVLSVVTYTATLIAAIPDLKLTKTTLYHHKLFSLSFQYRTHHPSSSSQPPMVTMVIMN